MVTSVALSLLSLFRASNKAVDHAPFGSICVSSSRVHGHQQLALLVAVKPFAAINMCFLAKHT